MRSTHTPTFFCFIFVHLPLEHTPHNLKDLCSLPSPPQKKPRLLGRELQPPFVPKGETYCDPEELDVSLSDDAELGQPEARGK